MPADGNIVYLDEILQHGNKFYKIGHTKSGRIRLVGLRMDYPGIHRYKKIIRVHENVALEEIIKALSEKWIIKCSKPPCPKEITITKDYPVKQVITAALGGLNYAKSLLATSLEKGDIQTHNDIQDSSVHTPFLFRRKKKMHRLLHGHNEEIAQGQ
jgi:hypothetical protein